MPSLNLRNVLRRNPDRPTLRQRAAALKSAAAKVIRRPKPEPATSATKEAGTILDAILASQVRELVAIEVSQDATLRATSFEDAYDSPDWVRMESDREKILSQVIATRAHTMEGVKAKTTLLDLDSVKHFQRPFERLSRSIAADVAALGILPRPEQTISTPGHADPHVALLPALRQAFAWTRGAHPISDRGRLGSPENRASTAVFQHWWSVADRILALPPPQTAAGLGVVALALSAWSEGSVGRDPETCHEERRTASAIRAMMSIAGTAHFPEWTGFGDEPDSEARWEAMIDRVGEGSLPAWALAGKSGPDEGQGLAQACIDMAERLDWLDRNENVSGFSEEAWDAEFNRQGAVFRRAIDEPSADAADLAAKARLALSDLDRFKPADRFQGDGDRLMRVVLHEAMALGDKSGSSDEGATDEGTPEIARVIKGPAASLPILDLSICSIPQIARLYEAFHATYDHLSALGQLSCFWENSADASRVRFNPAGDIVDREADRLAELFGACAEEIARREPRSARDSGEILLTRVMHELTCNGCIDDPALMRDVTTAWGA